MEMTGEQLIPAPQQAVWQALNDPEVLKACVPGCESIEPAGENAYQVLMVARVGGKLPQIGARLVDAAAKKIADDFFRNFNEKMAAKHDDPDSTVSLPDEEEDRPAKEPGDRALPSLSNSKLAMFAAAALVIV